MQITSSKRLHRDFFTSATIFTIYCYKFFEISVVPCKGPYKRHAYDHHKEENFDQNLKFTLMQILSEIYRIIFLIEEELEFQNQHDTMNRYKEIFFIGAVRLNDMYSAKLMFQYSNQPK